FGLNFAMVGLLRTIYSGTLASLQIPAAAIAARIGAGTVLSAGTALAGLCYFPACLRSGFALLVLALFLCGGGAATQHPRVRRGGVASGPWVLTISPAPSVKSYCPRR